MYTHINTIFASLTLVLTVHISISTCLAETNTSGTLDCIPVVLQGYDVIHYFITQNSNPNSNAMLPSNTTCPAQIGDSKYYYNLNSADYFGNMRTYQFWFSSQQNLDIFSSDPWKYAPKYGGFCTFGTCCEKKGWPWNGTFLGPPSGPDSDRCGFRIYNDSLYLNIWKSYDSIVFDSDNVLDNLNNANARWISWFGDMHAGIFNYGCFSSDGYSYFDCTVQPLNLNNAPLASDVVEYNLTRCDNVEHHQNYFDTDPSIPLLNRSHSAQGQQVKDESQDVLLLGRNSWCLCVSCG